MIICILRYKHIFVCIILPIHISSAHYYVWFISMAGYLIMWKTEPHLSHFSTSAYA